MKRLLITVFLSLLVTSVFSQNLVDKNGNKIDFSKFRGKYIELGFVQPPNKKGATAVLDFGQNLFNPNKIQMFGTRAYIADSTGEQIKFFSLIGVINYINSFGWELFQIRNLGMVTYAVMQREKSIEK